MTPHELPAHWRAEAGRLTGYGAVEAAATLRTVASELEAALRAQDAEALTLKDASRESGYSPDRLRHLVTAGTIPNAGRKGAPRIRRADLPHKPRASSGAFDAAAVAGKIGRVK